MSMTFKMITNSSRTIQKSNKWKQCIHKPVNKIKRKRKKRKIKVKIHKMQRSKAYIKKYKCTTMLSET
jgi:hypothetical protein